MNFSTFSLSHFFLAKNHIFLVYIHRFYNDKRSNSRYSFNNSIAIFSVNKNRFSKYFTSIKWPLLSDLFVVSVSLSINFIKFLKNILIKDEHIFEKFTFKIMQRCMSTRRSKTRCTHRKSAEHT